MSGIGFSELIILFVIGLIVLGPERLPRVANQLGGWIGQARRMTPMSLITMRNGESRSMTIANSSSFLFWKVRRRV